MRVTHRFTQMFSALALAGLCLTAPAMGQEMPPEERALLRSEVRAYLMEHPEVIMEAINELERRRETAAAQQDVDLISRFEDDLRDDGFSYVAGNPDGKLHIIEFSDYRCGYCKRAHEAVKDLLADSDDVRLVIKEFPILGPDSVTAARAALAAIKQDDGDKYLAFNDAMMTFEGRLVDSAIMLLARRVGLDIDQLREDMASDEIQSQIDKTHSLAQSLRIQGTPTFLIGDQLIRGFLPPAEFAAVVNQARQALN